MIIALSTTQHTFQIQDFLRPNFANISKHNFSASRTYLNLLSFSNWPHRSLPSQRSKPYIARQGIYHVTSVSCFCGRHINFNFSFTYLLTYLRCRIKYFHLSSAATDDWPVSSNALTRDLNARFVLWLATMSRSFSTRLPLYSPTDLMVLTLSVVRIPSASKNIKTLSGSIRSLSVIVLRLIFFLYSSNMSSSSANKLLWIRKSRK